jgi:cobalt-zinc-cadmium efflux system protein
MTQEVSTHASDRDQHGGHAHAHGQLAGPDTGKMRLSLLLTVAFVLVEAVAAWFANSLALLSDAGHNFADAAALGLSWYALWIAQKPAHTGMTYGYHRVGILAALVNAVSLVVIALLIFGEAIKLFRNPVRVDGWLMIGVSVAAICVNATISVWLHSAAKHDLNVRSAYLHMVGDAASALGVLIAGLVVVLGGSPLADAVASVVIGALILWSSWGILKESVNVLLEGTPFGLDMAAVENAIGAVPGVQNVHDLHVWTVGSGVIACSCHIRVTEQSIRDGQRILKTVVDELGHHFGISHTTVQIEVEGHEADDVYCTLKTRSGGPQAGRPHRH